MHSIHERPKEVFDRLVPRTLGGDLIKGAGRTGAGVPTEGRRAIGLAGVLEQSREGAELSASGGSRLATPAEAMAEEIKTNCCCINLKPPSKSAARLERQTQRKFGM